LSYKYFLVRKSAPQVPRMLRGVVARTNRARSGLSPICPKCHVLFPRARDSQVRATRIKISSLYFSLLFLDEAVGTDRANSIAIGILLRLDSILGSTPVVALGIELESCADRQVANSDRRMGVCPEFAARLVAAASKSCCQTGGSVGAIPLHEGPSGSATLLDPRRLSASEAHPRHKTTGAAGRHITWRALKQISPCRAAPPK
jgi:hypothetical protein